MADYLFYTYFEEGREYFVYKDLTFERSHKRVFCIWGAIRTFRANKCGQRKRLPISGKPLAIHLFGHLADG
jgi:hypothetical protein